MKTAVLFSGGLDSLIGYHYLRLEKELDCDLLFFNLQHKQLQNELEVVDTLVEKGLIPEVKFYDFLKIGQFEKKDFELPLRNLYLIMGAVSLGYENIFLANEAGSTYPDKQPQFFSTSERLLSFLTRKNINLITDLEKFDKTQLVTWYLNKGLPVDSLKYSTSCYGSKYKEQCGVCPSCVQKGIALALNGISTDFMKNNPLKSDTFKKMYDERFTTESGRREQIENAYKLIKD